MKILLDYLFPITAIEPTAAASTAFLKQVCVVANPKDGGVTTGVITECTSQTAVDALVGSGASAEIAQLFAAGMSKVYVLPMDDLDLAAVLAANPGDFFTILISNADFTDSEITATQASLTVNGDLTFTAVEGGSGGNDITITFADTATAGSETVDVTGTDIVIGIEAGVSTATQIKTAYDAESDATDLATCAIVSGQEAEVQAAASEAPLAGGDGLYLGTFDGVLGLASDDDDFLAVHAAIERRCAFHTTTTNKGANMFYAFGKLLSNALDWKNQQYITMPVADDVATLGDAESLYDDRISYVISDSEFGERLAFFVAGGKAIVSPYIKRNLQVDMQSTALTYISGNQPAYTLTQASLLEDELSKVINDYIDDEWIADGTVEVELEEDNFIASGSINIAEPNALWRVLGEMRATL